MHRPLPDSTSALLAGAVATVACGIAVHLHFGSPVGTLPGLLFVAVGLFGVTTRLAEAPLERLRHDATRWWALAFVAFVPYGLASSPGTDAAAAVGEAFTASVAGTALEAVAGATVLCAVAVTVLYGFARYGLYPGRPTPEERVLND